MRSFGTPPPYRFANQEQDGYHPDICRHVSDLACRSAGAFQKIPCRSEKEDIIAQHSGMAQKRKEQV